VNIKYSIIIPTYNHLEDFLKPCLQSIIKYTDLNITEVIVVANGCIDNTKEYVESLTATYPNIKLIEEKDGIGYTKATNLGLKVAVGEYIIPLNNDTVILDSPVNAWLDILEEPFKRDPQMGVTGPLRLDDKITQSQFIVFFCAMIARKTFLQVGLLDEIFSPGSGEDIDFCIKAQRLGYKIEIVPNNTLTKKDAKIYAGSFPIYHYAEGTFENVENYSNITFKRNSLINLKRHNKNIKLHLTPDNSSALPFHIRVHDTSKYSDVLSAWNKLDFENGTVEEIALVDTIAQIPANNLTDYIKEWYRVLKKNGKLIMLMPEPIHQVIIDLVTKNGFSSTSIQWADNNRIFFLANKV